MVVSIPDLEEIVAIASKIEQLLNIKRLELCNDDNTERLAQSLELPEVDLEIMDKYLSNLELCISTKHALRNLFAKKCEELRSKCLEEWSTKYNYIIHSHHTHEINLKKAIWSQLQYYYERIFEEIAAVIKGRDGGDFGAIHFEASVSSNGKDHNEYLGSRSHSRGAISILEKAFSYTNTISRAEKLRLAQMTNLEPKQVTIWFQNRRNRKPKFQRIKDAEKFSKYGIRKRKYDDRSCMVGTSSHRRRINHDFIPSEGQNFTSSDTSHCSDPPYNKTDTERWCNRIPSSSSNAFTSPENGDFFSNRRFEPVAADPNINTYLSSSFLLNSDGIEQTDLDDLQLNLQKLEAELSPYSADYMQLTSPITAAESSYETIELSFLEKADSPKENVLGILSRFEESSASTAAPQNLNAIDLDRMSKEIACIEQKEGWIDGVCTSLNADCIPLDEFFASIYSSGSEGQSSPSSKSTSLRSEADNSTTSITQPFDFSLEGLGIDEIFAKNAKTFLDRQTSPILVQEEDKGEVHGLEQTPSGSGHNQHSEAFRE